jgi:hypothetical protein
MAGIAILVNLLVLLGVLLRSLNLNLAQYFKKLVPSKRKPQEEVLQRPSQRCVDDDYEMDVGIGSSRAAAKPARRMGLLQDSVDNDARSRNRLCGTREAPMRN